MLTQFGFSSKKNEYFVDQKLEFFKIKKGGIVALECVPSDSF